MPCRPGRAPRGARAFAVGCAIALQLGAALGVVSGGTAQHSELIFARNLPPGLRMRGDWETPDVLLVAYHEGWDRELSEIITYAAREVPVQILMPSGQVGLTQVHLTAQDRCVEVTTMELDSPWIRDFGPVQVFDHEQVQWLDYIYNPERTRDDLVPYRLARRMAVHVRSQFEFLDGGAVVSNGRGLCVMTDDSLQAAGIEPYSARAVQAFMGRMGCEVTALVPALPAEQTGHADVVVQFLGPDVVGVAELDAERDPAQAALLDDTAWAIQRAAHAQGRHLRVVRVPMATDDDIFYSYLNGVRVGGAYLVPSYVQVPEALERSAYAALRAAMPTVRLVPIEADESAELGGALHCLTLGLNLPSTQRQRACRPGKGPGLPVRHARR